MTPAKLIEGYVAIRERKRELEAKHQEELKPFNELLAKIEMTLGKIMEEMELENLPAEAGTAYRTVRSSVTVADWDTFLGWIQTTGNWHLLERRASKPAVEEILQHTSELPPGINISRAAVIQVRKTT